LAHFYNKAVADRETSWQEMVEEARTQARPTRVSANGTIVLAAKARKAAGIAPGDRVVSIPVGPGSVLVERVGGEPGRRSWRAFLDSADNPLRGAYGGDPQAYVDELRGPWRADRS
jgi:bifunctional DNA-binding transcriptional regulator/antitoxin component of YhaV-PrlF toxin-antitoxin module